MTSLTPLQILTPLRIQAWALPQRLKRSTVLAGVKALETAGRPEKVEAALRRVHRWVKAGFVDTSDAELVNAVCEALKDTYARATRNPRSPYS